MEGKGLVVDLGNSITGFVDITELSEAYQANIL